MRKLDITGYRRGKLVAHSLAQSANSKTYWHCQCDCGGTHTVRTDNFMLGHVMSCPACECAPDDLTLTLHYFKLHDAGAPIAYVGFAVAYRGMTLLCRTPRLLAPNRGQRKNPLAHVVVRWLAGRGYFKCAPETPAISGWLRRHSDKVTLVEYPNEAEIIVAYRQHNPLTELADKPEAIIDNPSSELLDNPISELSDKPVIG